MKMATKRSSLFGSSVSKGSTEVTAADEPAPRSDQPVREQPDASGSRYPKAKTREGKRVATVYLDPIAMRQLQKIGFDEETTIQALLIEGVNAVFAARGLSRIA